jgi:hypothetical protein
MSLPGPLMGASAKFWSLVAIDRGGSGCAAVIML